MGTRKTFAFGAALSQGAWPVQEDGYFADPVSGVFALADGFGGQGAGDQAAKLALLAVKESPNKIAAPREGGIYSSREFFQRELFGEINQKNLAWNEKKSPGERGGCSLILVSVEENRRFALTSCGACSAILWRNGNFFPLLSPQGEPRTSAEAPLFPSQALGLGKELNPESRLFISSPGDLLFLLSSGVVWEQVERLPHLQAELSLRKPGSSLSQLAGLLLERNFDSAGNAANQAVLVVESH